MLRIIANDKNIAAQFGRDFVREIRCHSWYSSHQGLKPIVWQKNRLLILDQTLLPNKVSYFAPKNYYDFVKAIKTLQVRGAPLIGVTAGFALTQEAIRNQNRRDLIPHLKRVANLLKNARPTAVNLAWAVERIEKVIGKNPAANRRDFIDLIRETAVAINKEEEARSYAIGKIGAKLIKNNFRILTICNAGKLAAPGLGTALAPIYTAYKEGKKMEVYVLETRPLLQGARLTTFELLKTGIPTTLITDSAMGQVMPKIDLILSGADRIVANGDTANKVGTLPLAITAQYFCVPFYFVAPISTFDLTKKSGEEIIIEERSADEVKSFRREQIAPKNVKVYNPAFDITPSELITGIITDKGIIYPPFHRNIKNRLVKW